VDLEDEVVMTPGHTTGADDVVEQRR